MRKILYIVTQSELGGAQKNVLDLATGLKNKYELSVATGPDGNYELNQALIKKNIRNFRLRYLRRPINPLNDLLAFFEILALIKKERPQIIHLHSSKAGILGSLAGKIAGVKIVYTVHGAVFEASFKRSWRRLFLWLEKMTSPLKDKIICVSENDKKLWVKYNAAPSSKLSVIHNGIDYQNIAFLPKDEARKNLLGLNIPLFEAARGTGAELKIIGTIANLYPEKGLPYLVQAAAEIIKKYSDVIFLVIGEGFERQLLEEMIKAQKIDDKFIITGAIANAWQYLKAFDMYVLPSVKEGLPYTILEAMAANLPIVATYVGGIPEAVENENNGLLALPKNAQMLAECIEKLLQNRALAQSFGQNSLQKIKEFSLEKMISATEKIYENL